MNLFTSILLAQLLWFSSELNISEYIDLKISRYERNGEWKTGTYPIIKKETALSIHYRRFEYLLYQYVNPSFGYKLKSFYPDTVRMKKEYLNSVLANDSLVAYFNKSAIPFLKPNTQIEKATYSINEVLKVASKFFYCTKVLPNKKVRHKICIGFNGIDEVKWEEDYMLLEAFCYEAIFTDIFSEEPQIESVVNTEKQKLINLLDSEVLESEKYLNSMKFGLFESMEKNEVLKTFLVDYYQQNKENLAFAVR